ncbi:hypothetical protein [Ferruginivarius sediminum]|uniref:hypothetical protein n=1 Tax=Ferruginivarius sediminum TaxID=2661937 RepID=UPI00137B1C7A|nr:hypothetical protein [Ferruginivarius sediminum]
MRTAIFGALAAAACLLAGPAQAAQSWGLIGEEEARFEAKVVDVLCELTGNCPDDCGDGDRQLGLLKDDGTLIMPLKNMVSFAGAAEELLPYCGKRVVADGLFAENRGHRIFALQFVREAPDGEWRRANRFQKVWAEENGVEPDSQEAKQWFRNDPRIQELIQRDGKLGLGPEADKAYFSKE